MSCISYFHYIEMTGKRLAKAHPRSVKTSNKIAPCPLFRLLQSDKMAAERGAKRARCFLLVRWGRHSCLPSVAVLRGRSCLSQP